MAIKKPELHSSIWVATSCVAAWLDQEILATRQDDWRGNLVKERAVRYAVQNHVPDEAEAERIFELVKNQKEY